MSGDQFVALCVVGVQQLISFAIMLDLQSETPQTLRATEPVGTNATF